MERSWPVRSDLKSKRLKWQEPQADLSWAWVKQLREKNRTRRVYDVNPYVEVYRFRDNLYGLYADNLDGLSDPWMYVIVGPKRALLLDTAFGLGDLKGLVDEITGGMPLIVVNTHGGPDHSYGNCRFERVCCHRYDVPKLKAQHAGMWDYLFNEEGRNIWVDFDRKDLPEFRNYEIVPCEDGQIFDLGEGYRVTLFWMGGHTPGSSGLIDPVNRIFFPGDTLVSMRTSLGGGVKTPLAEGEFAEYGTVETLCGRLRILLEEHFDEFDYVFPQHLVVNVEKGVLSCELQTLEQIVSNPDDFDGAVRVKSPQSGRENEYRLKYIRGFGPVGYRV